MKAFPSNAVLAAGRTVQLGDGRTVTLTKRTTLANICKHAATTVTHIKAFKTGRMRKISIV